MNIKVVVYGVAIIIVATGCAGQVEDQSHPFIEETHQNEIIEVNGLATIANPENMAANINKETRLSEAYIPADLVTPNVRFSFEEDIDKRYMRQEASVALEQMFSDAKEEGLVFIAVSGYRSFERQAFLYENAIEENGPLQKLVAEPGYSEHQTGLAMDVSTASIEYELVEALDLLLKVCGLKNMRMDMAISFVIKRVKKGLQAMITNWHLRYVGIELAERLVEDELSLDEYHNLSKGI